MIVESIQPVSKERSLVTLEDGRSFVLYKGEIRILKLKENMDLSDSVIKQITTVVLPKRAKLRAMNLLKARPYTEYMLRKKLKDGGYPEAVIDEALDYVKSYGYVDDIRYARDYIFEQSSSHSKKEIYQKLLTKGIRKETLDKAFLDSYGQYDDVEEKSSFDEEAVIMKALKKKGYTGNETYEERQKILAYFYRRGFEMDSVFKAMDSIKD